MTSPINETLLPNPSTLQLNGSWDCITDPAENFTPESLPREGWQAMNVPSNWNCAGLNNYSGVVWYRKTFSLPHKPSSPARLVFSGVDYFCDVWLNGACLGHHEGYFQSFDYLAQQHLNAGANHLIVRVESPWERAGIDGWPGRKRLIKGVLSHHDCRPGGSDPDKGQEENTGGIWNDVVLHFPGPCELETPWVQTQIGKSQSTVELSQVIHNHSHAALSVHITVKVIGTQASKHHELVLEPGPNEFATTLCVSDAKPWSSWDQGEPNLYTLDVEVKTDESFSTCSQTTFGFRTIHLDENKRCILNGEPVFIRGTNVIPTLWLADYSAEQIARDIALLKEANVNAVRVHGHVQREEFYQACDEAGILVWCDFALQWGYVNDEAFQKEALSQVRDWVHMLRNRPSIMVWCCHNEPTHTRETLSPMLAECVRELDRSRPVIEASDFREHAYPGWYAGSIEDFTRLPAGPLMTEYGAQALPSEAMMRSMFEEKDLWPETGEQWKAWSYRNFQVDQTFNVAGIEQGKNLREFVANSQAYQAKLLKFATEHYRTKKWDGVTGIFQFMFMDCWPSISWSILDHERNPKLGYEALKKAFQPLLVTFKEGWHHRSRIEIGSQWSLATVLNLTIINDLPHAIENATLHVGLAQDGGAEFGLYSVMLDIEAKSVSRPFEVTDILEGKFAYPQLPGQILGKIINWAIPGHYRLIARVFDQDQALISENDCSLELVQPRIPVATPFLSELAALQTASSKPSLQEL